MDEPQILENTERTCPRCNGSGRVIVGNFERIVDTVCRVYNVTTEQLQSRERTSHVAEARIVAFYLIRKSTVQQRYGDTVSTSFPTIGQYFNRDHTTVIHGCNVVARRMEAAPLYRGTIEKMRAGLGGGA
jgi:chromosomal replication initiator protein